MKTAYFDCQFGAAGDMLCASLLANGLNAERWIEELNKIALPVDSFEIQIEDVMRCLIASKKMTVKCIDHSGPHAHSHVHEHSHEHEHSHQNEHSHEHEHSHKHEHAREQEHSHGLGHPNDHEHSHSHDHEHFHGHEHLHDHKHSHEHDHSQQKHEHSFDHEHSHESDHSHEHAHGRSVLEIIRIIENSQISDRAKALSLAIFRKLAESEARVHNVAPDDVHFHEVGAVDAIIDVVGFAIGYDLLGIEKSVVSPLTLGGGTVKTDHGIYPVPAPAVAYLVEQAGAPTSSLNIPYECLTPTGAAILTTIADRWGALPGYQKIDSIGYGAGTLNPKTHPNTVRTFIGQCHEISQSSSSPTLSASTLSSNHVFNESGTQFRAEIVTVIEATIDDCPPNIISYALEKALVEGALDIAIVPVTMKKGRSGHLITVLAKPEDRRKIETLLLRETSTLGVRTYFVERLIAEREFVEVKLSDWSIRIKIGRDLNNNVVNVQPEYEDCATYAQRHDVPLREVFEQALSIYNKEFRQAKTD